MKDTQKKYLTEAGLRIQHEGFTVCEEKDALLPVEWAGSPICNVNGNGGMSYDPEQIRKEGLDDALERVREIVEDTLTYMRHMETAPPLLADGLSGDYRLLAEYNGAVLAGHQTRYGVQFITWDRLQDGTLWQGHYVNTFALCLREMEQEDGELRTDRAPGRSAGPARGSGARPERNGDVKMTTDIYENKMQLAEVSRMMERVCSPEGVVMI